MEEKIAEVVGALKYLETRHGRTPSVKEVAEYVEWSTATALKWLDEAVRQGEIVKRDGKFMTRGVAEAYKQKE